MQAHPVASNRFLSNNGVLERIVDVRVVGRVAYGESDSADVKLAAIDGMQVAWGTEMIGDQKTFIAVVDERPTREP